MGLRVPRGRPPPASNAKHRLRTLLTETGTDTVVGGVVELLGLGDIRRRLGSDWDVVAPVVDEIAMAEIARRIAPEDVFERVGDDYVICFATASKPAARHVASEIALAIELLLVEQAAVLGVNATARIDRLPVDNLLNTADPMASMRSALVSKRPSPSPADPGGYSPAPQVLFQPIWPSSRWGRAQNRCILDSISGIAIARQFEEMDDPSELQAAIGRLDCSLVNEVVARLHDSPGAGDSATVLVPVHFHSLLGDTALELTYIGASLRAAQRRAIILDVIGIPASASFGDLMQAARAAREAFPSLVMQVHPGEGRCRKPLVELLAGASLHLGATGEEREFPYLQTFTACCDEVGLLSYAFGANTLGRATEAERAGFSYICGSAVHDMTPRPRSHTRFTPLFGQKGGATDAVKEGSGRSLSTRFVPADRQATLTLPDGSRLSCEVRDVSGAGAAIAVPARPDIGANVILGRLPGRVIRHIEDGVVVKFERLHPPSLVEEALRGEDAGLPQQE